MRLIHAKEKEIQKQQRSGVVKAFLSNVYEMAVEEPYASPQPGNVSSFVEADYPHDQKLPDEDMEFTFSSPLKSSQDVQSEVNSEKPPLSPWKEVRKE